MDEARSLLERIGPNIVELTEFSEGGWVGERMHDEVGITPDALAFANSLGVTDRQRDDAENERICSRAFREGVQKLYAPAAAINAISCQAVMALEDVRIVNDRYPEQMREAVKEACWDILSDAGLFGDDEEDDDTDESAGIQGEAVRLFMQR